MRIAIAQINTTAGDVDGNVSKVEQAVAGASAAGADLVVCPEFSLSGWMPGGLLREREFVTRCERALARAGAASGEMPVLLGHFAQDVEGRFCSAAYFLVDGCVDAVVTGARLPRRDVWSPPPGPVGRVALRGGSLAVTVGRPGPGADLAGADALVCVAAFPFAACSAARVQSMWADMARVAGVPVIVVNLVGGNGTLVFEGASVALNTEGRTTAIGAGFAEDLFVVDVEQTESIGDEGADDTARLYEALKLGLADYVAKCAFSDVVLGVSGGLDSAVTAAIAADALGPEHVTVLGMPSIYSSETTREAARLLTRNLGVRYCVLPIEDLRRQFETALAEAFGGGGAGTAEENIQARIRATLLMAYANKFGALALATGNRSELAMGYCTLYGDLAGGLAVIGDVPKTVVYELAGHINRGREVIPRLTIEMAPSAELKPGQRDEDDLPPYVILDEILGLFLDGGLDPTEIVERGFDARTVGDVMSRLKRADFKRRQAPPALQVYSGSSVWPVYPLGGRVSHTDDTSLRGED